LLLVPGLGLAGLAPAGAEDFGKMSLGELHTWIGITVDRFHVGNDDPDATRTSYRGAGCSMEVTRGRYRFFADARAIWYVRQSTIVTVAIHAKWTVRSPGRRDETRPRFVFPMLDSDIGRVGMLEHAFKELARRCH
jgi:hypothetical protein